MDSQARTPRCDLSHGKRSFQGKFLLSIWLLYLASGLSLAGLHLLGIVKIPRIQPAEEVLREEEILHVLQRFKTGLPRVEQKKLAWLIQRESGRYGQDYRLVLAIIKTESSFQYRAISRKGAKGLMQIRPHVGQAIARQLNIGWEGDETLFNPHLNVKMGLYYLSRLVFRFGELNLALTAYNFGPGFVRKRLKTRGKLPLAYSRKVLKAYREFSHPPRRT